METLDVVKKKNNATKLFCFKSLKSWGDLLHSKKILGSKDLWPVTKSDYLTFAVRLHSLGMNDLS